MSLTLLHRVLVLPIGIFLLTTASGAQKRSDDSGAVEVLAPTGSYAVGRMTLRWVDEAREESITPEPADRRRLVVHVWYPATGDAAGLAEYVPDLTAVRRVIHGPEADAWSRVKPHATSDAQVAASKERFPVVLFSPGNQMLSGLYSYLLEEIASHGYVVIGIDHPFDVRAVLVERDSVVPFADRAWPRIEMPIGPVPDPKSPYATFYRERVAVRVADARFVAAQLARPGALGALSGQANTARLAFLGHSIGGVAAGEACRSDSRFGACINLDGATTDGPFYLDGEVQHFAGTFVMLTKPFRPSDERLAAWKISREEWGRRRSENDRKYFEVPAGGAYRVTIDGATHETFSDDPIVIAALRKGDATSERRLAATVRQLTLAVLEATLGDGSMERLSQIQREQPGIVIDRWNRREK